MSTTTPDPVAQVAAWLLEGQSTRDILEAARDHLGIATPGELLAAAYRHIADRLAVDPDHRRAWHLEARRELYRRLVEFADFKGAHLVLKELAALEGITAAPVAPRDADHQAVADGIPTADAAFIVQ